MVHVVLLGHGSRDARHTETIRSVAEALDRCGDWSGVGVAFLDFDSPALTEAVADVPDGERVVVVPMLLTEAFHARVDVPDAVAAARTARPDLVISTSRVLGPAPELTAAMERSLREAGASPDEPGTAVLVVAAGTSDAAARDSIATMTTRWLAPPRAGAHAFVAGAGPAVGDAVRQLAAQGARTVAVSPYLLAPGRLPDRAFGQAREAGAAAGVSVVVAGVLGDAPELLDLVTARVGETAS